MMSLQEKVEHWEQEVGAKHFTCLECGGEYIGTTGETHPPCMHCNDSVMTHTREVDGSLLDFLRYG